MNATISDMNITYSLLKQMIRRESFVYKSLFGHYNKP